MEKEEGNRMIFKTGSCDFTLFGLSPLMVLYEYRYKFLRLLTIH